MMEFIIIKLLKKLPQQKEHHMLLQMMELFHFGESFKIKIIILLYLII
jgi:hypothetical protein